MSVSMAIELLGGLGLFLYGMGLMSDGLQRVAGEKMRSFLRHLTKNRFAGVATGMVVTSIIQSSSATTVMLVGFVNAGLLDLMQAAGVVMGANIGTTMTGWLVALIGFKVKIAALALPAVGLGFFVRFLKKESLKDWGMFLIGFGLLFLGLDFMKNSMGDLAKNPALLEWVAAHRVQGPGSLLLVIGLGSVVTMVVQSSSATMALTMTMAQQGLMDFPTAGALILGENIGTTITAVLAAIGSTSAAKQTSRVHVLFNVSGVIWIGSIYWLFISAINYLVPGDVMSTDAAIRSAAIPDHMAAFHTIFNLANTILFLPLLPLLVKLARYWVPDDVNPQPTHLKLLRTELQDTPDLAVEEARQHLHRMGLAAIEGFDVVIKMLPEPTDEDFDLGRREITRIEQTLDEMEEELTHFTIALAQSAMTARASAELNAITGSAHDFERMGDHLIGLLRLLQRRRSDKEVFSESALADLISLGGSVKDNLSRVTRNIIEPNSEILKEALTVEVSIDQRRAELRSAHLERLKAGECSIKAGNLYIEMLTRFERIGDHAFNVAQDFNPMKERA